MKLHEDFKGTDLVIEAVKLLSEKAKVRLVIEKQPHEQMPELMPKVMSNLMPHMVRDVVPLLFLFLFSWFPCEKLVREGGLEPPRVSPPPP